MTNVVREIEQEALQKGRKEGRKEGREEGREEVARKLLAEGESHERVARLTGLKLADVTKLAKK